MAVTSPGVPPQLQTLLCDIRGSLPDAVVTGGALRDLLLGRMPRDLDLVTSDDPAVASKRLAAALGGHAFPLDTPRGYHRVVLTSGVIDEIDLSHAEDLARDLARRDFTVDALAAEVQPDGSLSPVIDHHGGFNDLEARLVRMVSAANLADDPLRLLRAVRLAVELEFAIERQTVETVQSLAQSLAGAAAERRRDELVRILETPRAAVGVRLADSLGLLDVLLPELTPAKGVEQPKEHHYFDVFEHSVQALAALDEMLHVVDTTTDRPWLGPDFREVIAGFDLTAYLSDRCGATSRLVLLKLATLLHDVAKPETKALQPDGRIRFLGHPEQGAAKAESICARLRFGSRETRFVARLVEEHLRPTQLAPAGRPPSRRALYRFVRDLEDAAPACLFLSLADASAARGPLLQRDRWRHHVAYCRYVLYEASRIDSTEEITRRRLVNGDDLMAELGIEPGPALGQMLAQLDEAQAVGDIETREAAMTYARTLWGGTTPPPAPSPLAERGSQAQPTGTGSQAAVQTGNSAWRTPPELWDKLKPLAREHRHEPTPAERLLWERLRRNQVGGVQFRRQHAIDRFIVDFYCGAARLVVEVDGPIHDTTAEEDAGRQQFLEAMGLRVLRFRNEEVLHQTEAVVTRIHSHVAQATENHSGVAQATENHSGSRKRPSATPGRASDQAPPLRRRGGGRGRGFPND